MGKMAALLSTMILCGISVDCRDTQKGKAVVIDEAHIRQTIASLPADSAMRADLEDGAHGDGVHYPWMDHMARLGVKRAKILLDFSWTGHPVDIHLQRIIFFRSYDLNCSQIDDPAQLQVIEQSGLTDELTKFAAATTAGHDWTYFEHRPRASRGLAIIEVADDPWLPLPGPNLIPLISESSLPPIAVDGDLKHLQETLRSRSFSQAELNAALVDASAHLDDKCSIKALISAGANPNVQNNEKETPLIFAARAGWAHNVEALLQAGADPGIRDTLGETPLDVAQKRGHRQIIALLNRPAQNHSR